MQWPSRGMARGVRAFRQSVSALFQSLGLEAGDPGGGTVEYVTVDGFDIVLDQTDNEDALRMTVTIGLLSPDKNHRFEQMRGIMKRNLAHLRDSPICCVLEETDDQNLLVLLQSALTYADLRQADLADRLAGMISLAEIYQELIAAPPQRGISAPSSVHEPELNEIIFRP